MPARDAKAPVCALLLSGGRSRRMGSPKAWLQVEGESLLVRIARGAIDGGAHRLVVVVGSEHGSELASREQATAALGPLAAAAGVELAIVVGRPWQHPIDSIRVGLGELPAGDAMLLWPVDHPFADGALIRRLVAALGGDAGRVAVPVVAGRRAHPALLGHRVARELLTAAADAGARDVVNADSGRVVEITSCDSRLLADLNTPQQAAALGVRPAARA